MKLRSFAATAAAVAAVGAFSAAAPASAATASGPYCSAGEGLSYDYSAAGATLSFDVTCDGAPLGSRGVSGYIDLAVVDNQTGELHTFEASDNATVDNGTTWSASLEVVTGLQDATLCSAHYRVAESNGNNAPYVLARDVIVTGDC
ncbi:hypothetical protein [Salininema proteolyticum]|uniref:Uncharacterized protein n=1 Tax=Salininema proteolyticum TaxID=1607685 RepID=A0ABV8TYK1_9ACTN